MEVIKQRLENLKNDERVTDENYCMDSKGQLTADYRKELNKMSDLEVGKLQAL